MDTMKLPLDYLNQLATQTQFVCALLCGFSLTMLVLLFEKKQSGRLINNIFRLAIFASGSFLVSIFATTNMIMKTTPGYPFGTGEADLFFPRTLSALTFLLGSMAIAAIISLFGWTQSKSLGIFSTVIGIVSFILMMMMTG